MKSFHLSTTKIGAEIGKCFITCQWVTLSNFVQFHIVIVIFGCRQVLFYFACLQEYIGALRKTKSLKHLKQSNPYSQNMVRECALSTASRQRKWTRLTRTSSQDPNVLLKELGRMIETDLSRIRHGHWGQNRKTGFIRSLVFKSYNLPYLRDSLLCESKGGGVTKFTLFITELTRTFPNDSRRPTFIRL